VCLSIGSPRGRDLDLLAHEPIEAVYASTQMRAQRTARPLARARRLPVQVRGGLREISAGELEMRGDDEAKHVYVSMFMAWATGDLDVAIPGGEHGKDALARFDEVVTEAAADCASGGARQPRRGDPALGREQRAEPHR
jgi:broad specificity phosphatase PhoE